MKPLYYFIILLCFLNFSACTDCDPASLIEGSGFNFRILDTSTGEDVFPDRYSVVEFQVLTTFKDTLDIDPWRYPQNGIYQFFIDPTAGGQGYQYNEETRRRFFLQFDSLDTDTLLLSYIPRNHDCTDYMDDFKAYYNGELVFEGSGENSYSTIFYK